MTENITLTLPREVEVPLDEVDYMGTLFKEKTKHVSFAKMNKLTPPVSQKVKRKQKDQYLIHL